MGNACMKSTVAPPGRCAMADQLEHLDVMCHFVTRLSDIDLSMCKRQNTIEHPMFIAYYRQLAHNPHDSGLSSWIRANFDGDLNISYRAQLSFGHEDFEPARKEITCQLYHNAIIQSKR